MRKLLIVFAAILLAGCTTTKYVTVPEHHTDTLYKSSVIHDSIWQHDSVFVSKNGDTLFIEKWHNKYVLKEKTDTVYKSKTDSVPVPYPVEKLVTKPLTWYEKLLISLGMAFVFIILALIARWFRFR